MLHSPAHFRFCGLSEVKRQKLPNVGSLTNRQFVRDVLNRVFRKSLFVVELDPVPKICDANRYGELTKKFSFPIMIDPNTKIKSNGSFMGL